MFPSTELLAAGGTLALGLIGYFMRDLHTQFKTHLKEAADRDRRLGEHSGRIAVLSAEHIAAREWLERIDGKIDRLLERGA